MTEDLTWLLWCSDPRAGSHKIVFLTYDAGGHDECVLAFFASRIIS